VPADYPPRLIRQWINEALSRLEGRFSAMNQAVVKGVRRSIAPEKLIRAMLLQILYRVRSERQLIEQISHNVAFRWLSMICRLRPRNGTSRAVGR
jgi:hypothetical protein